MIKNMLILIFIILFACGNSKQSIQIDFSNEEENLEIPSNKIDYSIPRNRYIVNHLFEEAKRFDSDLRYLDIELTKAIQQEGYTFSDFSIYKNFNNSYYNSADQYLNSIGDSAKRENLRLILKASKDEYDAQMKNYYALTNESTKLIRELKALQKIMKLLISEKLVKNYQQNLPSDKKIKKLNEDYQKLISETERHITND